MSNAVNIENPLQAAHAGSLHVTGNGAVVSPEIISSATIEGLRDTLQQIGYRVETIRDGEATFLRSATNGLNFDIRLGNALANAAEHHADIAFVALFAIRGALPLDLVNRWNCTRRFGRLFVDQPAPNQDFLVFCMDVSVAGGVTPRQLRAQIEIWDGLVQQLIPWLREELSRTAQTNAARSDDAPSETRAPALADA